MLNARSVALWASKGALVEGGGRVEQGEADSNSTSAWCGGRAAGARKTARAVRALLVSVAVSWLDRASRTGSL